MSRTPIAEHALLSDCHSAALVDRDGTVVWWCPQRFDSPSVFGALLDDAAGRFRVGPAEPARVERRYLDGTLVLATTFRTASGTLELTEALALGTGVRAHDLGAGSPHTLLRRAVCRSGSVEVALTWQPRMEYGLTIPATQEQDGGIVATGGATRLVLSGTLDRLEGGALGVGAGQATAHARLHAGESLELACEAASSWAPQPAPWSGREIAARLEDTAEAWRSWERAHQGYTGPYDDLVRTSGRVLQALTYQPTGAIVAAPTTSLPEAVGGERNWDYRYAWVRDASLTLDAMWVAACPDEARAFVSYLSTVASTFHEPEPGAPDGDGTAPAEHGARPGQLQIMFAVTGERDLTERELGHLDGWCDSRPVRVGNGAWDQRQLDVYGEVLAAVDRLRGVLGPLSPAERRFLTAAADAAAAHWGETDQGIWEIRGEPRHFLHSKLLCWVALDRAIDLAPALGAEDRVAGWAATRAEIREAILERGWSERLASFTQSFDRDELDASSLLIPLLGLLPGDDPRVLGTIRATEAHLTDERGLVYRYRGDDGLEGAEGTFLLCTFWLAEALALAGQPERAREVFERAIGHRNDVDLLAEEVDPASGALLGNFPQAFSHVGLVNAAWAIDRAEAAAADQRPTRPHAL